MAAKQFGTHRLSGTLGGITYSHTKSGFKAREKTRVNMADRMYGPQYQAWRDHASEFRIIAKEAKIFRKAFMDLNWNIKNKSLLQETIQLMNIIRKTDSINPRGQRRASAGELNLLTGFDFTGISNINNTLMDNYAASFNRITGEATTTIKPMIPKRCLNAPAKATHFILTLAAAAINFETEVINKVMVSTPKLLIDHETLPESALVETLTVNGTEPVLLVLKLEYYTEINSIFYPLISNADISCTVILVDRA
jgi:hypothetical protein